MVNNTTICPYCGTEIEIEEDIVAFRCPNCDAAIVLDIKDGTADSQSYSQTVNRTVIEPSQKDGRTNKSTQKIFIIGLIAVLCIAVGALMVALSNHPTLPSRQPIQISMPYSLSEFKKMDYMKAKEKFESAGFSNVKCVQEDKTFNVINGALNNVTKRIETGDIKEIEIDQTITKFKKGDTFLSDSEIVITYYNVIK